MTETIPGRMPLAGIRVLDLSRLMAGNMLTLQLADFGAEVIKVESAEGDTLRMRIPSEWNPRSLFTLASRRHPLVLGAPAQMQTRVSLQLPAGFEIKKLPMASR